MTLSEDAIRDITAAEEELKKRMAALKKALSTLGITKIKVSQNIWPLRDLRKLLANLDDQKIHVTESVIVPLVLNLKDKLKAVETKFQKSFETELAAEAQKGDVTFGFSAGVRFLGPFELTFDFVRESASLYYAKQPASRPLPLDFKTIVDQATKLEAELLKTPLDASQLAAEFEEAHRVALIRDRKPVDGRETRSTLPELFRELQYIRQDRGRQLSAETFREYSLARFVVEMKTLVQSESNLTSSRRFRLETAVIENTKNSKKSVFVPADLKFGYGEGTYFQALVLVNEGR